MRFKKYLEVIERLPITTNQQLQIQYINPEDDWELAAEVEAISRKVQIRSNRGKDVHIIALVGETVIGGVYSEIHQEDEMSVYDFDVVVDPQYQGYQNVGFKLIEAAIQEAKHYEVHVIKAFVVNNRLAPILANKYGFDGMPPDGKANGGVILYKYI